MSDLDPAVRDLDPAVRELLAAVVQLDERTRYDSEVARSSALALAGDVLQAVLHREVQSSIGAAVLAAWRPVPPSGVLVTRPHDWPRRS